MTRGVLEMIVRDEALHGRFGSLYLEWAAPRMDERERARLARVASSTLARFERYWRRLRSTTTDGVTSEGFLLLQVHELGWMESAAYAAAARAAVRDEIVAPLARFGIHLDEDELRALLR